ncbi:MAG: glycosyltransferase [Ignavibacteria bacterium]|nr:glycosyltransferase [Ignavibacteria bacterium]
MELKICYIISNLSIGGAQLLLFDIINNLKNENLEITVITIDSGYYIKKFENEGINVIDIKSRGLINPLIFLKLKKILKKIQPDIVHTHLLKADFYGRIVAKWIKVPLIFSTCHNDSTIHSQKKDNKNNIFDSIDNWVIDYTNSYIIAISEKVKQFLINRKDEKISERISVIYNGIDTKKEEYILNPEKIKYFRSSLGLTEKDFILSIVGRLEEQKGHLKFLSLSMEVIKEHDLKVLIIGDGSQKDVIKNFIKAKNLENNVFLLGFIPDTEKYYEISHLIVIPSVWEGFGIVACEGMIKSKIVLASKVGGLPEIIEDGVNGFLYNDKDLKKNLVHIILNYDKLNYIKEKAIQTVKNKFDIKKNSKLYYLQYIKSFGQINK